MQPVLTPEEMGAVDAEAPEPVEVLIGRAASAVPSLALHDTAAALAAEHGVVGWHISLSHTATMAEAVVIALST
jgi:phosphopantetheinyl transferase (holo-ACP synthase)